MQLGGDRAQGGGNKSRIPCTSLDVCEYVRVSGTVRLTLWVMVLEGYSEKKRPNGFSSIIWRMTAVVEEKKSDYMVQMGPLVLGMLVQ